MMQEGLVLMVTGMGVVTLFLVLMVYAVHGTAAIIRRLETRAKVKVAATEGGAK
jgi:sodium pump decarboxylase gamma subunit